MSYLGFYKIFSTSVVGVMTYVASLSHPVASVGGINDPIYKPGMIYAPILMYHHVAPKIGDNPYYVSPDIFEQQMAWLHDNNYNVISLDKFYNSIYGDELLPSRPVVLTFDDGAKDHYLNAYPAMKKYGFTGTFYIITNDVGGRGFMSWDMLKEMVRDGMDIQSHTVHHPNLAAAGEDENRLELAKSKKVIEEKLGTTVKHLAYPGGAYSDTTIKVLEELGYLTATTVKHSQYHSPDISNYEIPRMHIDSDMESFAGFVTGRRKD